jgi:uncharacterized protein (TIGR02099 family)
VNAFAAICAIARRVLRRLPVLLGFAVILAAVAIGAFRLLAARLPTYKGDVQAWVRSELGLLVEYEALDLRLTLTGPELQFYGAALASGDADEPFVLARAANIRLDGLDLLLNRRFTPTQLTFEGIEIAIERAADGELRIEGIPAPGRGFDFEIPRSVKLVVRDSRVTYEDEVRDLTWPFEDVEITVEQSDDEIEMSVNAAPPPTLASRIELSIEGDLSDGRASSSGWRGFAMVRDADLVGLTALLPDLVIAGGHGDVSVWIETEAGQLTSVLTDMALKDVAVDDSESGLYDRIAMTTEWSRSGSQWTLALNDVVLDHAGSEWPRRGNTVIDWSNGEGPLSIRTDYLKLEDLTPIIARLPASELRDRWLALAPRGELRDFAVDAENGRDESFEITGEFVDLGLAGTGDLPAFGGLTGAVRADARGGSIRFDSAHTTVSASARFGRDLAIDNLAGLVLWRRGRTADRLVTDDLAFDMLGTHVGTSLELGVPHDGTSPRLDLESRIGGFDVETVKPYVVAAQPREVVASWLDRALAGGHVDGATLTFFGPLNAFPFDAGEGQFRVVADVRDGILDYAEDWPRAEDFNGEIEFLNAGFAARGRARVLGNASENVTVTIDNLVRDSMLHITADTTGPLEDLLQFLLEPPSIARFLGPGYSQLSAPMGTAKVRLDLGMPLPVTADYDLRATLEIVDGTLAFEGFEPEASDINGFLDLEDGVVTGHDIAATFLDGPVTAQVAVPERPGYRSEIVFEGEVSAESALAAFALPYRERLAGQTRWRGRLSLPDVAEAGDEFAQPALVEADANLSGVALRFPEPFAKAPRDVTNLHVAFSFGAGDDFSVSGNLGASRHFVGKFVKRDSGLELTRGRLSFGEQENAALPAAGFELTGTLPRLDLDAWRALLGTSTVAPRASMLSGVDLAIGDLTAFGQSLGATQIDLATDRDAAVIQVDSEPVSGRVRLSLGPGRATVTGDFARLYLQTGRASDLPQIDPRTLPGLDVSIGDFRVGPRQLGRFEASVVADPLGLRLSSFTSETSGFHAEGGGAWLRGANGLSESRLELKLTSADVATALADLGFDPIIEGQGAELTASLHWPGGPSPDWMNHMDGDISLRVDKGSMLDIEPGAGRIVGLMSIAALPRRLALDFRDVFNRGFAFDEITADFELVDGNAYTDNLMLSGPAAEIGVVGRTGLRDRDFHQQAVVTAEPGNMLPTVGGLLAGPGVGAALLIFTRIFKKPLRGLGRVAYCIEGSWNEPTVERLTDERLEQDALCAELPPEWEPDALVEGAQ